MKVIEDKLPKIKTRKEFEEQYEKWVANDQTLEDYDPAQQYASLFVKNPTDDDVDKYRDEWFEITTNLGCYIFSDYGVMEDDEIYNEVVNNFGGEEVINWNNSTHPVHVQLNEKIHMPQEKLCEAIGRELLKTHLALKKWSDEKIKNHRKG